MSCCDKKDCDCHQNSSFIFGLIIGLIISALVAIYIYKNNRQDVFVKLKKQIEKFFSRFGQSTSSRKPKTEKKEVIIPKNLVIATTSSKPTIPKAKKMFKK